MISSQGQQESSEIEVPSYVKNSFHFQSPWLNFPHTSPLVQEHFDNGHSNQLVQNFGYTPKLQF